jgi:hypothetical protein
MDSFHCDTHPTVRATAKITVYMDTWGVGGWVGGWCVGVLFCKGFPYLGFRSSDAWTGSLQHAPQKTLHRFPQGLQPERLHAALPRLATLRSTPTAPSPPPTGMSRARSTMPL